MEVLKFHWERTPYLVYDNSTDLFWVPSTHAIDLSAVIVNGKRIARCSVGDATVVGRDLPKKLCVSSLDGVYVREENYDVSMKKMYALMDFKSLKTFITLKHQL